MKIRSINSVFAFALICACCAASERAGAAKPESLLPARPDVSTRGGNAASAPLSADGSCSQDSDACSPVAPAKSAVAVPAASASRVEASAAPSAVPASVPAQPPVERSPAKKIIAAMTATIVIAVVAFFAVKAKAG